MPRVAFDRYYRFDELTQLLKDVASESSAFVDLQSIGKSHEGRDIWLLTITEKATGRADEKPAFWVDGNIHASEVSASTAALMVMWKLLHTDKGREMLKTHTFYIAPRLCPDGAEWALESPPRIIRSSTRPYPYEEDDIEGLERKDIDGDGRILSMRMPDANGPWKVSPLNPRLLVRRDPGESGGSYYRVLPEGEYHNFDGMTMRSRKVKEGLDMNRNFPSAWRTENDQHGAGPFPTSEPEIRAAVSAIVERPNICGAVTFHTFSGVHLRPPSRMPDDDIPAEDLWAFQELGKKGLEMTGYPAISNYHEFRYHPKEVITGVFDDWMYEHRGVFSWTTEIWSPQRQAGITDYKYIDWYREHPHEDDVKMLAWSDEKLDGNGYVDWAPFSHPQLGAVEIGGWDFQYAFRNPPLKFLESEVAPLADWVLWQASCSPRLTHREIRVEEVAGAWKVRWAVQNAGWLPTNVSRMAADRKMCRGVLAEASQISGAEGWLVSGKLRAQGEQLTGWSDVGAGAAFGWGGSVAGDVAIFEWVIGKPGEYAFTVRHDRAGVVRQRIVI